MTYITPSGWGGNKYPNTLTAAYYLTINWKGDAKGPNVSPNDGVDFDK